MSVYEICAIFHSKHDICHVLLRKIKNANKKMTLVKKNDFEEIWDRIKKNTDIKNMTQLSQVIGMTQGGISRAKKRNNFSAEWAYLLAKRYGLLTEWIMTGQGPKRIEEAQESSKAKAHFLHEIETWAREVSGSGNLDWLENQLESQFPAWKKWREEKEKTKTHINKVA